MNNKKYANEQTQHPKIYESIYWGRFKQDMEDEIIQNRNRLVDDFNIIKGFGHNDTPEYVRKMMNPSDSRAFDHTELYRTSDRKYLLVISPYGDFNDYLTEKGWNEIYKIYSPTSRTYYKLISLR